MCMAARPYSISGISLLPRKWFHTSLSQIASSKRIRIKLFPSRTSFLRSCVCILSSGATPAFSACNAGYAANSETEILHARILPLGGDRSHCWKRVKVIICQSMLWEKEERAVWPPWIDWKTNRLLDVTKTFWHRREGSNYESMLAWTSFLLNSQLLAISTTLRDLPFT